jgi:hypothetical protein
MHLGSIFIAHTSHRKVKCALIAPIAEVGSKYVALIGSVP